MEETTGKIVVIDWGLFLHKAIFAWEAMYKIKQTNPSMFLPRAGYTCLNMIFSCLFHVGVSPYDDVMVAVDYGHSWRKKFASEYKANRKDAREAHPYIDWAEKYQEFNNLLDNLEAGTNWHVLKENSFEADDWMSGISRFYSDREVILITSDSDMEQLTKFNNVKIFSPTSKRYKIVKDPYLTLSKKIEKEKTDNLMNPVLSKEDYEIRKMLVSLMELPDFVDCKIKEKLQSLTPKQDNPEMIPYNSMKEKYERLYNTTDKIVTFDRCLKYEERKKKIKSNKAKEKRALKQCPK